MTTRQLSEIRCNQNRSIREKDGTVLTKLYHLLWLKRHFEGVLNRSVPNQPHDFPVEEAPLQIRNGQVSRGEIKAALKQLKTAKLRER